MKDWIEEKTTRIVDDVCDIVRIRSVRENEGENKPFGKGIKDAVCKYIEIAKRLNLDPVNYDDYAVEITIGNNGNDDTIVGVLGHLDVVDGGEGWIGNPFEPRIENDLIYGRGTVDDKGPMICALYAAAYIQEKGLIPDGITLRIIAGTDEECCWECMKYYKAKAKKQPKVALVVDGNFPVIFCEKGVLDFDIKYDTSNSAMNSGHEVTVHSLKGGTARNVVPSSITCVVETTNDNIMDVIKEMANKLGIYIEPIEDSICKILATGKGAHAMNPEKGENAIAKMMTLLYDVSKIFSCNIADFVDKFDKLLGKDYYGECLEIECEDELTGPLTVNVGTIEQTEQNIVIGTDIRIPASKSYDAIVPKVIQQLAINDMKYEEIDYLAPINISKESMTIKVLLKVYRQATGDEKTEPIAIGGATYARCLDNAVSFGPLFPGQEDRTHEANEYISISDLKLITLMYINGILRLMETV